jgi:soluble lytic murein transglycosylase-like protein
MKTKPIKKKNKVMIDSAKYLAQKTKKPVRIKQKIAKVSTFSKGDLIGRALVFVVIVVVMVVVYVYNEGPAQAETQRTSQSPMQIVYKLYKGQASYNKKKIVREVLLGSGVKEDLCEVIAETIVDESNKTNIPVEMYLAIMKKESTFRSRAVSPAFAKGIMQIQGGTWDAYVEKHNLSVTREDIFQPQANIMVASVILKELYDNYAKLGYQEQEIWHYVLAAYYGGPASVKNGIKGYHWRYIEKVKQYYNEFELQIAT